MTWADKKQGSPSSGGGSGEGVARHTAETKRKGFHATPDGDKLWAYLAYKPLATPVIMKDLLGWPESRTFAVAREDDRFVVLEAAPGFTWRIGLRKPLDLYTHSMACAAVEEFPMDKFAGWTVEQMRDTMRRHGPPINKSMGPFCQSGSPELANVDTVKADRPMPTLDHILEVDPRFERVPAGETPQATSTGQAAQLWRRTRGQPMPCLLECSGECTCQRFLDRY